jgi:hypothetical protein
MQDASHDQTRGHHGNVPCMTTAEVAVLRDLVQLRRSLATKNLARRFNVSVATIVKYANGVRDGRAAEDCEGDS